MAKIPCYCGSYELEPADADYVKDGRPLCASETCAKVAWHHELQLRRTPDFDDIHFDAIAEKEMDSVPREIQAHPANHRYGDV
jgi:hypothetical protein